MPISSGNRTRYLLAATILIVLSNAALAAPIEAGVSRDLAIARAARISNIRYRLSFTLKEHESAVAGTQTLTIESKTAERSSHRLPRWCDSVRHAQRPCDR